MKFPFAKRRWALPVLVDLYRTPEVGKAEGVRHRTPEVGEAEGVRHRTPAQSMCRLLRLLLIRFPNRTFVLPAIPGSDRTKWPGSATGTVGDSRWSASVTPMSIRSPRRRGMRESAGRE